MNDSNDSNEPNDSNDTNNPSHLPDGEGAVAIEAEREVKTPRMYRVLLHNDDYTTMEFVVMCLMTVFHHAEQQAVRIMLQVHQQGAGQAGVYTYEVAEARVSRVARLAREHEFPLRCSMEPE